MNVTREHGWQNIETAPKDGTRIFGYFEHTMPEMQRTIVRWSYDQSYGHELWLGDDDMGWTEPTHWQPLPLPPVDGE